MRSPRILTAAAALIIGLSLTVAGTAGAHPGKPVATPTTSVLTTAVGLPYNLEVRNRRVLVAEGAFPGLIGEVKADGTVKTLIPAEGVSGLTLSRNGRYLAYTYLLGAGPPSQTVASGVTVVGPGGVTAAADALAYEKAHNPDHTITYGVDPAKASQCVIDALLTLTLGVSYNGLAASRATSVAAYGKGFVLVDSAANSLLRVSTSGKISTLAVLPPQPFELTADFAARHGLADCVLGLNFNLEAAPSDVEVGRDGYLYVTTMTRVPQGFDIGPRGSVYRVNPSTGAATPVATGLAGPTNLALSGGKIYVTEHDAGMVSVVQRGNVSEFLSLPGALSIESGRHGALYVGTDFTGEGSILKVGTKRGRR